MRSQRGQTAAEYLGALLIVATVIGALATTSVGASVRRGVSDKVCAIASGRTTCRATFSLPSDPGDAIQAIKDGSTNWKGATYIARGARDPDLVQAIRYLYRSGAEVGDGGTADILIQEAESGCVQSACRHFQKATEVRTTLVNLLSRGSLSSDERGIIGELISGLNKAIVRAGGK